MTPTTGIAGVFDRAADTYDTVGVPWFGPIAQGLVDELAVRGGERVLDVGCGRGAALLPLARAAGPSGSVLGIDLAPRMVELTARDAAGMPQVVVRVTDACSPGPPAASLDVVAACLVLFFLPDPVEAVASWARLLGGGGRLGVTTFGAQDPRWQAVDDVFTPYLPPTMLDARASGRRGPFASDEGVEAPRRDAGLVDVRTAHREVVAVFDGADQLLSFTWSHGQRVMWEAVPVGEHDHVRRVIGELVESSRDDDGPVRWRQQVRHTLGRRPAGG